MVQLVGEPAQNQCASGTLLPKGIALNVNYPPLPSEETKGILITEQGQLPYFKITYAPSKSDPTIFSPIFEKLAFDAAQSKANKAKSDTAAYQQGYIIIVPIDGNYSSEKPQVKTAIASSIEKLKP